MSAKLRIALISEHASPLATVGGIDAGGQNIYVAQVARHLAARGHAVDVYTRRDHGDLAAVVDWEPGIRVVHVLAGPTCFVPKEKMLPLMDDFTQSMLDFLRREHRSYDVIHANFFMSGLVAANLRRVLGIPYVVTFHALGKVRRLYQGNADGFPKARVAIEENVAREADAVIAECPQDQDDLERHYHVDSGKIEIIPGGFDPAEFWPVDKTYARRRLGLSPEEPTLLYLGRIVPRKGVDTVIQAFARLQKKHGKSARLLVVGGDNDVPDPGTTPELGRLRKIAEQEGVRERINFAGLRPRQMLRFFYSAADMFVTTPWYEPFGITPLEAMACGTPVIGSCVGGIKFTVHDGVTGFLVPAKNPDVLADKMAELYGNPERRRTMCARAVRRVHHHFTWRTISRQLENLYARVARRGMAASGKIFPLPNGLRNAIPPKHKPRISFLHRRRQDNFTRDARKAVFLDKDGTLVENMPYNVAPERMRLMPRATQALLLFQSLGYELIVVSNQGGVALGKFPEHMLHGVAGELRSRMANAGIPLAGFYWCPHHPDAVIPAYRGPCECRKPAPGLLHAAARDLRIDLSASWMIGDILDDVEAGRRAGCRTILIENGGETQWRSSALRIPDITVNDLHEAALVVAARDKGDLPRERAV